MEAIQEAIHRLENIPTTIRKRKDVEAAMIQLPSTARLLELPSASLKTFAKLAENLRARLLPLYRVSLSLTLEYVIAVFRFIHYSKLVPTLEAGLDSPNSWETLLISLFSGLLDILEENSNNKTRENIAYALYPILCPLYFVPTTGSLLSFHGELLSMVYQILTATVASHPRNAATLREHHIEKKSLGITISQTKDFLAIESLLDLFGSMIPSTKGGRDKRTAFIKAVFDPVVFKSAGSKIHKLLEDISSPDWSITSVKIIQILAENDLSFPQPFEASGLLLNESFVDSFSPFYIDSKKFVINIDKDGRIETLSLPYSITKNILVSSSTDDNLQILVQLTKSPMLGDQPMLLSSEGNPTISWNVKKLSLASLVKALKSRGLNIGKSGSNKLSKVKPIELDFFLSNKQDSQILTQKRFEQLSQSWALPASPNNERTIDQPETSPLLPDALRQTARTSNTDEVALPGFNAPRQSLTSLSAVSINLDGNLSLMPQTEVNSLKAANHSCPTTPSPHSRKITQKTSDEDDTKTLQPKLKRRQLVISDDESEATVEDESKSVSIVLKSITKMPLKQNPFWPITTPIESLLVNEKEKVKVSKFQKPEPSISEHDDLNKLGKRQTLDVKSDIIDVDVVGKHTRPPKRGRQEATSSVSIRPHKRVKYTRKGRTCSPAVRRSPIDFEEIPKPEPLKKVGLELSTKSRASAMKRKNGKPVLKPNASTKERNTKVHHVCLDAKPTNIMHPEKSLHDDVPAPSSVKEEVINCGSPAVRRSARMSSLRSHSKAPQCSKVIESSTPKKPRKAPWEDPDFPGKSKGLSDQVISTSDPVHSSPIAEANIAQMTEQSSDIDFFTDNTQSDEWDPKGREECYTTAIEHKNLGEPLASNHPAQEVDLTIDTSPVVREKAEKTSKPADVCICRSHRTSSHSIDEEMLKKEELLEGAGIVMKTSIPPSDKAKPGGQTSFKKIKIEEQSSPEQTSPRPVSKILKIEKASPSIQRTTANSKFNIQKDTSVSLAVGDGKGRPTVNFTSFPIESLQPSNKIQISPVKSFEVIDRERQNRESVGYGNARHTKKSYMRTQVLRKKITADPIQSILEVIQQINEVVVHNIENRFEKVTEGLNAGQRAILEATANSLQDMYHESARHFNEMVDLEEDYTAHRTIITSGTHDYIKSSEQLVQCFKDVALDHSRQSLSKRLPATLFSKLPAIILNPAVKL